jgi:GTPase SAR1 family protein
MVVGNGRVGKTQLCRRLRGLSYDPGLPSTHGIVVESFDLPRGDRPDFAKVHIWDFGGQDIITARTRCSCAPTPSSPWSGRPNSKAASRPTPA